MEKSRILTKDEDKHYGFHDHQAELQVMLKVIYVCDMDDEFKTILRMRTWGMRPDHFHPLTCEQISILTNSTTKEIERLEGIAKKNVEKFLLACSTEEAVAKFNEDSAAMKSNMFAKQPYQKKRFSV